MFAVYGCISYPTSSTFGDKRRSFVITKYDYEKNNVSRINRPIAYDIGLYACCEVELASK
jgi:hypothetical protein